MRNRFRSWVMAWNSKSELSKRVVVGLSGVFVVLLLIALGGFLGTALVTVVISLAMMNEYAEISLQLGDKSEKRWTLLGITWLIAFFSAILPADAEFQLLVFAFLGLFGYFLFTADRHTNGDFSVHFKELVFSVFGLLYVAFLPLFIPQISKMAHGVHWVIVFLMINWAGDTAAYFVGKKYGTRKLYRIISPKKTVEGAIGGLAGSVLVTFIYKLVFFRAMSWSGVFIIPIIVGAVAQAGDLCESFLKRAFDKKDSGSILPGHGGFLDRFDGVVFSAPVMYECVRIFG